MSDTNGERKCICINGINAECPIHKDTPVSAASPLTLPARLIDNYQSLPPESPFTTKLLTTQDIQSWMVREKLDTLTPLALCAYLLTNTGNFRAMSVAMISMAKEKKMAMGEIEGRTYFLMLDRDLLEDMCRMLRYWISGGDR